MLLHQCHIVLLYSPHKITHLSHTLHCMLPKTVESRLEKPGLALCDKVVDPELCESMDEVVHVSSQVDWSLLLPVIVDNLSVLLTLALDTFY